VPKHYVAVGTCLLGLACGLIYWMVVHRGNQPGTDEAEEASAASVAAPRNGPEQEEKYDIAQLMRYRGPSHRVRAESDIRDYETRVAIYAWSHSPESVRTLDALLSSQGIPYFLDRIQYSHIMFIVVPRDRSDEALRITAASVASGVLEYRDDPRDPK